ncbi:hypothetical protein MRB53_034253 [Persea americana]|uniref:Uncharacterized protein n=1 Tax=Persea americana TaxID=3435 RepID=A0ACC2KY69_PERAE|nr:hypothetical protein MRB53_034253 [Persea americana]
MILSPWTSCTVFFLVLIYAFCVNNEFPLMPSHRMLMLRWLLLRHHPVGVATLLVVAVMAEAVDASIPPMTMDASIPPLEIVLSVNSVAGGVIMFIPATSDLINPFNHPCLALKLWLLPKVRPKLQLPCRRPPLPIWIGIQIPVLQIT